MTSATANKPRPAATLSGRACGSQITSVNNLNQITQRDYPGTNDVVGVALATNSVTVNGQTAWRKGEYFRATVVSNNTATAQWEGISVAGGSFARPEIFMYPGHPNNSVMMLTAT